MEELKNKLDFAEEDRRKARESQRWAKYKLKNRARPPTIEHHGTTMDVVDNHEELSREISRTNLNTIFYEGGKKENIMGQ